MYVKVYIKNNQIFREDNGSLVGECVIPLVDPSESIYKCNGKLITVLYGCIGTDNFFIELCKATSCSFQCLSERKQECRYCSKNSTEGFYIEVN